MYALVLTGGPCAGKTSVIEALRPMYEDEVHFVPEAATQLAEGGYPMPSEDNPWTPEWQLEFQKAILQKQIDLEEEAAETNKRILLLDRGRLDGLAYLDPSDSPTDVFWDLQAWLEPRSETTVGYAYDRVVHLETLAVGAGYSTQNNGARFEDPKEAVYRDYRLQMVYRETDMKRTLLPAAMSLPEKIRRVSRILQKKLS